MSLNSVTTLDFSTELFIDDVLIKSKRGVTRTIHAGIKHETPVLYPDPDKPWEYGGEAQSKRVHVYGTTMYDRAMGKYRMWYMCRMGPHWRFKATPYQAFIFHDLAEILRPFWAKRTMLTEESSSKMIAVT